VRERCSLARVRQGGDDPGVPRRVTGVGDVDAWVGPAPDAVIDLGADPRDGDADLLELGACEDEPVLSCHAVDPPTVGRHGGSVHQGTAASARTPVTPLT